MTDRREKDWKEYEKFMADILDPCYPDNKGTALLIDVH
jgi:hypothetical protein